jgi:hypothetical protein
VSFSLSGEATFSKIHFFFRHIQTKTPSRVATTAAAIAIPASMPGLSSLVWFEDGGGFEFASATDLIVMTFCVAPGLNVHGETEKLPRS